VLVVASSDGSSKGARSEKESRKKRRSSEMHFG
jgi:hypothetical protein